MPTGELLPRNPAREPTGDGCDIFVIEDDALSLEVMSAVLASSGYRTSGARSGVDALSSFARDDELPRLILLDLVMPGMSGEGVLQELRSQPRLAPIPVVLVSGKSDLPAEAERLKVAGYVTKPSTLAELLQVAERFVAKPQA